MILDEWGLVRRPNPRPIPNGPATAATALADALAAKPEHEALVGRHRRFTYRELDAEADRAATALTALGIGAGDRVAASLPNQTDVAVVFLAAMRIGAIWVGIGRGLAPPEKHHLLDETGASLLVCTPTIAAELSPSCAVRVVDPDTGDGDWTQLVAASDPDPPPTEIDPHAPAAIAYTSGTTGRPKGAVHSQHNMVWAGALSRNTEPPPPDERHGVVLPMTLLNLEVLGPLSSFIRSETCVAIDRTDPTGLAGWIESEQITRMIAVPTILHDLLTHPDVGPDQLASLRRPECGGSHTPQPVRDLFRERFGQPIRTGYGLTEAPASVSREPSDEPAIPGSSGRIREALALVIVDDDGVELGEGEPGEICLRANTRGPWAGVYTPTLGYWNNPDATREALRGGVLHTGDLGLLRDGHLFVNERRSDLIIRGGANISPAEVERVLTDHPTVGAAAVLGIADDRLGERVVAAVEPVPGTQPGVYELGAHCRQALSRAKVPDRFVIVDRLPRNPMGKIVKRDLVGLFADLPADG